VQNPTAVGAGGGGGATPTPSASFDGGNTWLEFFPAELGPRALFLLSPNIPSLSPHLQEDTAHQKRAGCRGMRMGIVLRNLGAKDTGARMGAASYAEPWVHGARESGLKDNIRNPQIANLPSGKSPFGLSGAPQG